ncbi:MAG: RDD family protein [Candidatus Obscuribacterales bacterium]|nr:RDD family protein [Candidatus Obscuribacterales bacterium]
MFAITFCYHIVFEGIWQGQTPGKRVTQIRVIETNGQPVGWSAVFIRNIVRVLDTWVCLIGLLFMLVNKSEKRIGDLAAGTLVIRERKSDLATRNIKLVSAPEADSLLDIGRITPQEYDLLAKYLRRRDKMVDSHRPQVAKRLEDYFRKKLAQPASEVPTQISTQISTQTPPENLAKSPAAFQSEVFLEKVFVSYQARAQE